MALQSMSDAVMLLLIMTVEFTGLETIPLYHRGHTLRADWSKVYWPCAKQTPARGYSMLLEFMESRYLGG